MSAFFSTCLIVSTPALVSSTSSIGCTTVWRFGHEVASALCFPWKKIEICLPVCNVTLIKIKVGRGGVIDDGLPVPYDRTTSWVEEKALWMWPYSSFANELYNSSSEDRPDCFKFVKNLFKNSIQDGISQTQIIAKTWYTW